MSMRRIPSHVIAPVLILLGLLAVYLFLNISGDLLPGSNWATINEDLIAMWPFFIALIFGLYVFVKVVRSR